MAQPAERGVDVAAGAEAASGGIWPAILKAAGLLAVLLAAAVTLRHTGAGVLHHVEPGWRGAAVLAGAGGVMAAAGLPRQVLAFTGGYVFGAPEGAAIALLGQVGGCALDYFAARLLASGLLRRMLAQRTARRLHRVLTIHPFSATLTLRLLPVGSNVMLNLLAGATHLGPAAFFSATVLGYLPQTIIFALLGGGTQIGKGMQLAVGTLLLVAASVLGVMLYRRVRRIESQMG